MRAGGVNPVRTECAPDCIGLIQEYVGKQQWWVCAGSGAQSAAYWRGVTCVGPHLSLSVSLSLASPSGWSDGSCLPGRAWPGRRLSISAPSARKKPSGRPLPVRNWRASFWQPNRSVINCSLTSTAEGCLFCQKKKIITGLLKRDFCCPAPPPNIS